MNTSGNILLDALISFFQYPAVGSPTDAAIRVVLATTAAGCRALHGQTPMTRFQRYLDRPAEIDRLSPRTEVSTVMSDYPSEATNSAVSRRNRRGAASSILVLACVLACGLACWSPRAGRAAPTDDSAFDYRAHGQKAAVFDWGGDSVLDGLFGERRLDVVERRAHIWIESDWRPEDYLLAADSPVVTLTNANLSYLKYTDVNSSVARDSTQRHEDAFLHTADPACLTAFCVTGGVEIHWQPDRRIDYAEDAGTAVMPTYRVYRVGESEPVFSIGEYPDPPVQFGQHLTCIDTPPAPGTYTYKIVSVLNGEAVAFSETTVTYPGSGLPQDNFWIEDAAYQLVTTIEGSTTTYSSHLTARLAARWGATPDSIRVLIFKPSHVELTRFPGHRATIVAKGVRDAQGTPRIPA